VMVNNYTKKNNHHLSSQIMNTKIP